MAFKGIANHFETLLRGLFIPITALLLPIAFAFANAPTATKVISVVDRKVNLRITHLIFRTVIQEYFLDAPENEYRKDFILYRNYLESFLNEWDRSLSENQPEESTKMIWQKISERNTYLGHSFDIWKRIMPSIFGVDSKQSINLGYYRETFLVRILRTESILDLNHRVKNIMDCIASTLASSATDSELTLAFAESFLVFPEKSIQEAARNIKKYNTPNNYIVKGTQLARDLVTTLVAGNRFLSLDLPDKARKWLAWPGLVSAKSRQILNSRVSDIPKLKEFEKIKKLTPLAGAAAVNVAAIGLTTAKMGANNKKVASPSLEMSETIYEFLSMLAKNSQRAESLGFNLHRDSGALRNSENLWRHSRQDWIRGVQARLTAFASNNKVLEKQAWLPVFLEGERLVGDWPEDKAMAEILFNKRLAEIRGKVSAIAPGDFVSFQKLLFDAEIRVYRGEIRSLTSVFLNWGGNCVSRAVLILSLLREYPHILPKNSQIGLAVFRSHVEPVLIYEGKTQMLVDPGVFENPAPFTIMHPEILLALGLRALNAEVSIPLSALYVRGKEKTPVESHQVPLSPLKNLSLISGAPTGLFSKLSSVVNVMQEYDFNGNAPEYAESQYAEPRRGASSLKKFTGATPQRPAASSRRSTDKIKSEDLDHVDGFFQLGNKRLPFCVFGFNLYSKVLHCDGHKYDPNRGTAASNAVAAANTEIIFKSYHYQLIFVNRSALIVTFSLRHSKPGELTTAEAALATLRKLPTELWPNVLMNLHLSTTFLQPSELAYDFEDVVSSQGKDFMFGFNLGGVPDQVNKLSNSSQFLFSVLKHLIFGDDPSKVAYVGQPSTYSSITEFIFLLEMYELKQINTLGSFSQDYEAFVHSMLDNELLPLLKRQADLLKAEQNSSTKYLRHFLKIPATEKLYATKRITRWRWRYPQWIDQNAVIRALIDGLESVSINKFEIVASRPLTISTHDLVDVPTVSCKSPEECHPYFWIAPEKPSQIASNGKIENAPLSAEGTKITMDDETLVQLFFITGHGLHLWQESTFQKLAEIVANKSFLQDFINPPEEVEKSPETYRPEMNLLAQDSAEYTQLLFKYPDFAKKYERAKEILRSKTNEYYNFQPRLKTGGQQCG